MLGSINYSWQFPGPNHKLTAEQDRKNLLLLEIWETWWQNRSPRTRDADGFELLRAINVPKYKVREGEADDDDDDDDDGDGNLPGAVEFRKARDQVLGKRMPLRYDGIIDQLLNWFEKLYPPTGTSEFLLNAAETALAHVPPIVIEQTPKARYGDEEDDDDDDDDDDFDYETVQWREEDAFTDWLQRANTNSEAKDWTPEHSKRLFNLYRWLDEPTTGRQRKRPAFAVVLDAYKAGAATLADIYDHLIGPREIRSWGTSFDSLQSLTSPTESKLFPDMFSRPELRSIIETVVARIIESELTRGETPTPLTPAANGISQIHGRETLFRLIAALGNHGYGKNTRYSASENKPAVLTQLIRHCVPEEADTPAAFAAAVKVAVAEGLFPIERIAELGLVNPRWVTHVCAAIGWPGYDEAVYWFIAHTGSSWQGELGDEDDDDDDDDNTPKEEKPENPWRSIVKARTNLTSEQLGDGLIDVAWFNKAYAAVGDHKRWDTIEAAAKFLGYGQEHKKAMRLADVLLGKTKKKDLVDNIRKKFLKESVRLLGLLPLPTEPREATRRADRPLQGAEGIRALREQAQFALEGARDESGSPRDGESRGHGGLSRPGPAGVGCHRERGRRPGSRSGESHGWPRERFARTHGAGRARGHADEVRQPAAEATDRCAEESEGRGFARSEEGTRTHGVAQQAVARTGDVREQSLHGCGTEVADGSPARAATPRTPRAEDGRGHGLSDEERHVAEVA